MCDKIGDSICSIQQSSSCSFPVTFRGRRMDERTQENRNFNLALLFLFKLFLTFRFFLLLYLLVPTYTTFIRAPSYQNFHYFSISFDNPRQPLLFIVHRLLLSLTYSQPATGCTALLSTALWVQPCPTTTFSSFSSVCRPTSPPFPFARPTALLVLNPTSHQHKHTSI